MQVTLEYNDPLDADAAVTGRLPAAIAAGIRYAVAHGATVISLPLDPGMMGARGGAAAAAGGSQAERAAVAYAISRDVLLVAPAGDNAGGGNAVNYPAAYPGVIAVGATARDGALAPFTNTGSYVALTAPGAAGPPVAIDSDATAGPPVGLTVARPGRRVPDPGLDRHGVRADGRRRRAHPRSLPVAHGGRGHPGDRGRRDRPDPGPAGSTSTSSGATGRVGSRRAQRRERARPGRRDRGRSPATRPVGVGVSPGRPPGRPRPGAAHPAAAVKPGNPGRALRSVLVDVLVAVCVLIAGLICALAVTWVRRRRRAARADDAARDGRGRGPGRHSRDLPPAGPALQRPPDPGWPPPPRRAPPSARAAPG